MKVNVQVKYSQKEGTTSINTPFNGFRVFKAYGVKPAIIA
jgi:hypothetical protein